MIAQTVVCTYCRLPLVTVAMRSIYSPRQQWIRSVRWKTSGHRPTLLSNAVYFYDVALHTYILQFND